MLWLCLAVWLCTACAYEPAFSFVVPPPAAEQIPGGRLVIRNEAGNLLVTDPAGTSIRYLTEDASPAIRYEQPAWSPAGDWIAWVQYEQTPTALRASLQVASPSGQLLLERETAFPPFYLYWNEEGTLLSFLSNWVADGEVTLGLSMMNVTPQVAETQIQLVGVGQPFYYAWSPAGDALLVHSSLDNVYVHDASGVEILTDQAAAFGAPMWAAADTYILYGDTRDGVDSLVQRSVGGDSENILSHYREGIHLALYLNAAGTVLAVVETPDIFPSNAFGLLYLYDLADRTIEQVTAEPVLAAHWSPDGRRLLFWQADLQAAFMSATLRVWEAGQITELGTILLTPAFFQQYLPFSDQYALSHRIWAPDSQQIVYAAQDAAGRNAVYVQDAVAGTEPEFVTYGDLAFWSYQ